MERKSMGTHARGEFDVKLAPQAPDPESESPTLARLTIEKQFRGDLVGTSRGEMLSASTSVQGSAGYVAMELVTGELRGRKGTFAFQHSGTMTRGAPELTIKVVPDSGTADLVGLAGTLDIEITGGKHFYDFEYTLPGE
jgi:uncharacterized protein DUF3224